MCTSFTTRPTHRLRSLRVAEETLLSLRYLLRRGVNIVKCDGAGSGAKVTSLTDNIAASNIKITGGVVTGITDLLVADGGTGSSNASGARTNLGLVIGSGGSGDVQPYDQNLKSFVDALTLPTSDGSAGQALTTNGSGTVSFNTVATAARAYTYSVLF